LQAQITATGLDDVVTLAGPLPQQAVFEKLRGCDIFALASTFDRAGASDVFPTVILEAMASARPVVSTAIAGIPEAVVHGLTGLVVPSGDPEALANALDRLIRDQWLRFTFGSEGRAAHRTLFPGRDYDRSLDGVVRPRCSRSARRHRQRRPSRTTEGNRVSNRPLAESFFAVHRLRNTRAAEAQPRHHRLRLRAGCGYAVNRETKAVRREA
jgi:glycosyltransferase involved in cell wall biosynthesis